MKRLIRWALNHIPRPVLQRIASWAVPVVGFFYRGSRVECSLASGVTLFSGAAQGTLAIPTRGHRGVVVVSVEVGGRTHVAKAVAR